jgi:hypothetical protein
MDPWLTILIIVLPIAFIIGNISAVKRSSHKKLREKGLNDLTETLPRSIKTQHTMNTPENKKDSTK